MKSRTTFILICCLLVTGCSWGKKDDAPVHGVSGKTAEEMNAQRNQFETSEDPPLTADTHYAAGFFAESQGPGAIPQAVKQYEMATHLDPKHGPALFRLGMLYTTQLKDYPKAIDAWKRYLTATNNSAIGYSNLGVAQQAAGDYKSAEASFQSGIKRDPKNQPCRVNYGIMLAKLGRAKDALAQFQAVLSAAEAHYNLGSVYEGQGKSEQARAEFRKSLELDPTFLDAQERLAKLK